MIRGNSFWPVALNKFPLPVGGWLPRGPLVEDLREHIGQDAAGAVVVNFDGGVDADDDGDVEGAAVGLVHRRVACCMGLRSLAMPMRSKVASPRL